MTTIRDVLQTAIQCLEAKSDTARLDAQLLLNHVLDVETAYLYAHPERELTDDEHAAFMAMVDRRCTGEPIAYILGEVGFYDLMLSVTPDVLIPRPETEQLVEIAIEHARSISVRSLTVADVGTGSGAIAVTFARHVPSATVYAVEVSEQALKVARENNQRAGTNVQFLQGNLIEPLIQRNIKVDLLMANLPYIDSEEVRTLEVSRHEPMLALDGGEGGFEFITEMLKDVRQVCNDGALILLEIGADQGMGVLSLASSLLQPRAIRLAKDYAGHDRIVRIEP